VRGVVPAVHPADRRNAARAHAVRFVVELNREGLREGSAARLELGSPELLNELRNFGPPRLAGRALAGFRACPGRHEPARTLRARGRQAGGEERDLLHARAVTSRHRSRARGRPGGSDPRR
jgi:hypothetical protein